MTTVRDFEGPERAPTLQVSSGDGAGDSHTPISPVLPTPRSPMSPGRHSLHRQASGGSRLSVPETIDTLRHRKPSRSNTVTTYHEPEISDASGWQPGAEPGVDTSAEDDKIPPHLIKLKTECDINVIDFSDQNIHESRCTNADLEAILSIPRTEELPCRWISVNGLSWDVIRLLGNRYNLHRLAIEDLIHTKTRTKVDWYAEQAYVVLTLQKLVRLHQHRGRNDKCTCTSGMDSSDEEEIDEKFEALGKKKSFLQNLRDRMGLGPPPPRNTLPQYMDRDHDGKVDEFVSAHSGISDESPVKAIRTLHRYESAQIPEHTAWMERHSALAQDNLAVSVEQVSIFLLSDNSVISFFEHSADDVERPILNRLNSPETMLRRSCDASLLLQAIIDAVVDLATPVRDAYNKSRKELQIDAMTNPNIKTSRALHIFGEEVDMLQNLFKPIVHLVNSLRDHNSEPPPGLVSAPMPSVEHHRPKSPGSKRNREGVPAVMRQVSDFRRIAMKRADYATSVTITPLAHTYFGDVLDHCITMIQALEQMDASAGNISTLIFNTVGAQTNNFMMILAVVTVFFAPLTFISGYFGMNFASGHGLAHPFAFFWIIAIPILVVFMLLVFGFMLWDKIRDFLARRGVKARWHKRTTRRGGRR
ncbi:Cobalt/magnesium transport protein CorA [Pseudocercospora fuligena]|uniref:Cobalt/magnesium transport protein CorA n=1 Tax=Pseudocercospora fuligena TaxID=685502 RepID=A0A8H6VF45_9PEZI|nr:Cobalt/magnesium transport protein CorA [Pseudocercospora fuligena]